MEQTLLLPDCAAQDRWRSVVSSFRLRPGAKTAKRKPLPAQLFLTGMAPVEDVGGVSLGLDDQDYAVCKSRLNGSAGVQPTCPNCGGTKFDEDGDCTSCWEPAVARPAGATVRATPSAPYGRDPV
jgi:hypothetical protein